MLLWSCLITMLIAEGKCLPACRTKYFGRQGSQDEALLSFRSHSYKTIKSWRIWL